MKLPMISIPTPGRGRPRAVDLTDAQGQRLAEIYLATNRTRAAGSMEAAWVLFCESEKVFPETIAHHRLVGALPTAALEWMRKAKGLVTLKRGGSKELRLKGPYQQGGMRTHWEENRRLHAGEVMTVDDLTRNAACWIPWPHGGCECSEKYGVRLGRWQTLTVGDHGTWAVPSVSSVFRYASSYTQVDAASIIHQTECNVGMRGFTKKESWWVVEGGVWQSKRLLEVLGDRFHSAKGRPMQKLIERWFGAFQTIDAAFTRDLGRQRGEVLENNQLWLDCRAGKKDPRKHFMGFEEGHQILMHLIRYMNEREVRSDLYGKWVPQERWDRDVEAHPLVVRDAADSWLCAPEKRTVKVSRAGMVQCKVIMADGVSRSLVWNAPELYELMGMSVDLYFDPLGEWPLQAVMVKPGSRKILGLATCQNPFGESRDADRERVAAIRRTMMSDLNIILGGNAGLRRTEGRGMGGTITITRGGTPLALPAPGRGSHSEDTLRRSEADHLADREKNQRGHTPAIPDPRHTTVAAESIFNPSVSREGTVVLSRRGDGRVDPLSSHEGNNFDPSVSREGSLGERRTTRGRVDSLSPDTVPERQRSLSRRAEIARGKVPNF